MLSPPHAEGLVQYLGAAEVARILDTAIDFMTNVIPSMVPRFLLEGRDQERSEVFFALCKAAT